MVVFQSKKIVPIKKSIKIVTMVPINLFLRTKARYFSLEIYTNKELLYAARSVLTGQVLLEPAVRHGGPVRSLLATAAAQLDFHPMEIKWGAQDPS
jgi:hypothetical protein